MGFGSFMVWNLGYFNLRHTLHQHFAYRMVLNFCVILTNGIRASNYFFTFPHH
jgi:hypothetical protein